MTRNEDFKSVFVDVSKDYVDADDETVAKCVLKSTNVTVTGCKDPWIVKKCSIKKVQQTCCNTCNGRADPIPRTSSSTINAINAELKPLPSDGGTGSSSHAHSSYKPSFILTIGIAFIAIKSLNL